MSDLGNAAEAAKEAVGVIPENWPTSGPDFNKWYRDAAAFVALVQAHPSAWLSYMPAKYLNIRIDTRSGDFVLTSRDGGAIDMDHLLKVWRDDKFRGAYGELEKTNV